MRPEMIDRSCRINGSKKRLPYDSPLRIRLPVSRSHSAMSPADNIPGIVKLWESPRHSRGFTILIRPERSLRGR
jgi:hypothetical protein